MMKMDLAAEPSVWERIARLRTDDLSLLAPKMRDAVEAACRACIGVEVEVPVTANGLTIISLDVDVFETLRSDELQAIYHSQGSSRARTAAASWHGYGLAVDVISAKYEWFTGAAARAAWPNAKDRQVASNRWFGTVGRTFEAHGLDWGGRWTSFPDPPHYQWGRCRVSPSQWSRDRFAAGDIESVQREVWAR